MTVARRYSKSGVAMAVADPANAQWLALNRHAVTFFASLLLLCSVFVAVPWKHMSYGAIDGYEEIAASQDSAAR
ncbi:MAG TPA: hypothetical protein VEC58_06850 [Roseiarcus sp.]|nr:hypothetical protein [Roseiarcus sp.]